MFAEEVAGERRPFVARGPLAWGLDALQAEQDRWILWLPVCLGTGIGVYFALPVEPPWWSGATVFVTLLGWVFALRHKGLVLLPILALCVGAAGFMAAQGRTEAVRAPVLEKRLGPVTVTATVAGGEKLDRGQRVVLEELVYEREIRRTAPERVRVKIAVRTAVPVVPGQRIRLPVVLLPPPEPSLPRAYNFPRRAWFERLGAVGYAVGAPEVLADSAAWGGIAAGRAAVTERVRSVLPGPEGAVAAALITGDRGGLDEGTLQDYRDSGLAHLLSISGLHMSLIAGLVFFVVRGGLALIPAVALRYNIKKWAALGAILGTAGYLALSGAGVPTQRAFIMTTVVLGAVLIDRTAISLRTVAWAAVVVLLIQPEALTGASFQLSFAAVVALVAAYEAVAERMVRWRAREDGWLGGWPWARFVVLYIAGVGLTTLIAGTATAPFAVYHFHRFAVFGVAANLIAVPLTALWVMPMALAALVFMPLGWDAPFLQAMGGGVSLVNGIAAEVAAWPGARAMVPALPMAVLIGVVAGGLWLCLWRGRWRWMGVPVMAAALIPAVVVRPPDVLINGAGTVAAWRDEAGAMRVLPGSARETFTRAVWAEHEGQAYLSEADGRSGGIACGPMGCTVETGGSKIAWVTRNSAFAEDCSWADVLVTPLSSPKRCAAPLVWSRWQVREHGAATISLTPDGPVIETAADLMGQRPWTPQAWRK